MYDKNKQERKSHEITGPLSRYSIVFWTVLLICIICLTFSAYYDDSFVKYNDTGLVSFEQGWHDENGKTVSLRSLGRSAGSDGFVTLQKALPKDVSNGDSLAFRSKNIDFRIYVDGKLIYDFFPKTSKFSGKSYGSCFHYVPISDAYAGKTVTIKAYPIYSDGSSFLGMMKLGDDGTYFRQFVDTHAAPFLICIVTIFLGLLMLILAFMMRGKEVSGYSMVYIGTLAIMLGIWSGMETLVPQMLIGHSGFMHGLNYIILMMLPFPAIQFSNSLMAEPKKQYTHIATAAVVIDFVVCTVLNYSGIMDYHQCLPIIHTMLIATVAFIIVMFIRNKLYCRKQGMKSLGAPMLAGFLIFVGLCMVDLGKYIVTDNASSDAGYFLRVGILIYILILFVHSLNQMIKKMRMAGEAEMMRKVAYTDALTGVSSRAACLEREEELDAAVKAGEIERVLVCQFDVNDLKKVNDRFGHIYGDRHLRGAAEVIDKSFGTKGNCYRVGGDEFTVFIVDPSAETVISDCKKIMVEKLDEYNSRPDTVTLLGIACGSAWYDLSGYDDIEKAEIDADKHMYEVKSNMKE